MRKPVFVSNRTVNQPLFSLILMSVLLLVGCEKQSSPSATKPEPGRKAVLSTGVESTNSLGSGMQANPLESTNVLRSFVARGVIRELPAGGDTVVVKHDEIPGFMPKMTMQFSVRDTNELRGLRAGDAIAFRIKATEKESWVEAIQKVGTNELAQAVLSDPSTPSLLHAAQLRTGDLLSDTMLLGENGRAIELSSFQGSALAFTFLFTRCPLPDFCPRMNQHFSRARELLLQKPGGPTNWQFLSISFDPEFDQPGVLTRYAYSYRGKNLDRWTFAAAPTNAMSTLVPQLDFRFAREGDSFLHNLRTVVLDPQRRVYKQFDGNKWKAEELAQAMAEAACLDR